MNFDKLLNNISDQLSIVSNGSLKTASSDPQNDDLNTLAEQHQFQVEDGDSETFVKLLYLNSLASDCLYVRKQLIQNNYQSSSPTKAKLHNVSQRIDQDIFINTLKLEDSKTKFDEEQERLKSRRQSQLDKHAESHLEDIGQASSGDDFEALRKRLLSTNAPSKLDEARSLEEQNVYHESIHQDIIFDISSLTSQLKESALSLQGKLKEDASILKEASEQLEKNQWSLTNVGKLLGKYHKEGKLGFWFYVRVSFFVLLTFVLLLLFVFVLPGRR
ncbi:SNARE [Komagataella phaffii CBS 7435]|uniref:Uncharacterized protein n=2 Tax=Komagataella phaffii TaxID=460519 RepID=C4QWD0_KOMPG|nr:uncharacterized protein PAS_chr1-1_0481 [Komagataella phaffii GS115]AOA61038.1 GQ67_02766T0 [Komagataella phaffii]CAH2446223.1 Putative SNARE protein [Komagataella phaffii CBS 7435]AOA65689.1 GQ68_02482T0 [Komagataella phaffii GS115]CAY67553.1 hypothetical protein PAS_chr1-1_0481 [Komagataella phaffii GS115]SCV11812.1 SNARE [Komagataella phaffii CBS 7435]